MSKSMGNYDELPLKECSNSSDDEENPIKSIATVKHQIVRSPVNFARLEWNTDLNVPPPNWMSSSFNSYGFQQALSQPTGFSSFRMAHSFPDCVGEVDVIGNAENIKHLLKLPYSQNSQISMIVHRIGNTLLIDDFDIHRFLLKQEDYNWQWLSKFIYENVISFLSDSDRSTSSKQTSRNDITQQLLSKFLYYSLSQIEDPCQERPSSISFENLNILPAYNTPVLPESNVEDNVPDPKHTNHTFNRNVVWTFEDIRMLIGTDMAIFGGSNRPCISLRLRDMHQPINILTGIDYWLDNLMCNVPEVAMCYHLDGFVQKYEIVKTEDLPYLEGSTFSPNVIRNVAQNILSFLKQNATKSGHTYWLFKGRKDDVVKLYDLTSLNTADGFNTQANQDTATNQSEESNELDDNNPFTVPVAMLLYKVARNMKATQDKIGVRQAGSIKALLDNCLKLLPAEKYPQIVSSSYYLLSDLHFPFGTDPENPTFEIDDEGDAQFIYDDNNSCSEIGDDDRIGEETGVSPLNESTTSNEIRGKSIPPPITRDLYTRCINGLEYIANGLECLQYISISKEENDEEHIHYGTDESGAVESNDDEPIVEEPLPYLPEQPAIEPYKMAVEIQRDGVATTIYIDINFDIENEKCIRILQSPPDNSPPTIDVISWNSQLKVLLLEKACLIYSIHAEHATKNGEYGAVLRFVAMGMTCYDILKTYKVRRQTFNFAKYQANMIGRAADCLFHIAKYNTVDDHHQSFHNHTYADEAILKELNETSNNKWHSLFGSRMTVFEDDHLMMLSILCYKRSLDYSNEESSRNNVLTRLANVLNEIGVMYMDLAETQVKYLLDKVIKSADILEPLNFSPSALYHALAKMSDIKFKESIELFKSLHDTINTCIVQCNMGRLERLQAHLTHSSDFKHKRERYDAAFGMYKSSLKMLDLSAEHEAARDINTWELVNSKTLYANYLMQNIVQIRNNKQKNEKLESVFLECIEEIKKYCLEAPRTWRYPMYQLRIGLSHHLLANFYRLLYDSEISRLERREKLIRMYFDRAIADFEKCDARIEGILAVADYMAFHNNLWKKTDQAKRAHCIHSALKIASNSIEKFDPFDIVLGGDDNKLLEHLGKFETQILLSLRLLNQSTADKRYQACKAQYKELYSSALLTTVDKSDYNQYAAHLQNVIKSIQKDVLS